ncbi:putative glycerol-1-phosphate prenyltransferase [Alkalibacillus flavidus]|uniref:Heptaprenylglyceryl phosphate synthase n=1 Tax=Alkalibacillus flavidus TaxID=546021 RepID=A0ABV2KV21_9BACI
MTDPFNAWRHVFKLDPNKYITDSDLHHVCQSGTDAIMIGGTDGVTLDDVVNLLARVRRFKLPCLLEVSNLDSITPGFDYYVIPTVLNSGDKQWMIDLHHEAVKTYGDWIEWDELYMEGYVMLNPASKAYQYTNAKPVTTDDVVAYARLIEHLMPLPIMYLEYSGTYGDVDLVERVSHELNRTTLIYGGGIETKAEAQAMAEHAQIVVVGDVIYRDIDRAIETVEAVKQVER